MPAYKNGEDTYNLPENRVAEFLEKYPNATLIEEEEIVEKPTPLQQESAPVKANGALDNTESLSADTSSELPLSYKVGDDIYNLPNESRVAELLSKYPDAVPYDEVDLSVSDPVKVNVELEDAEDDDIGFMESTANRLGRGFASTAAGLSKAGDAMIFAAANIYDPDMTTEEKILLRDSIEAGNMGLFGSALSTDKFEAAEKFFSDNVRRTESESITEALSKGNWAEAAELTIGGALESAPSILAAMTGIGGIAMFGASVAGNKFDEEFDKNPEESLKTLYANAAGNGVIEASFELVTRGLLKKAGFININNGKEAAKAFLKQGATDLVKKVGWTATQEGASEAATEVTSMLYDGLTLGKENIPNSGDFVTRVLDAGIIGAFMGGNITTLAEVGGASTAARNRAESMLTPIDIKEEYTNAANAISQLQKSLESPDITTDQRKIINNSIQERQNNIARVKGDVSIALQNLTEEELVSNFELVNTIEKNAIAYNQSPDKRKASAKLFKKNIEKAQNEQKELFLEGTTRALETDLKTVEDFVGADNFTAFDNSAALLEVYPEADPNADAFFLPDGGVVVNKDIAAKVGAVSAGSHELLHKILKSSFESKKGTAKTELVEKFKNILSKEELSLVEERIDKNYRFQRDSNGKILKDKEGNNLENDAVSYEEEYFTAFSDVVGRNQIKYNENLFTKVKNYVVDIFKPIGYTNIDFKEGEDIYNFIKDYQRNIKKGKVIVDSKRINKQQESGKTQFSKSLTPEITTDAENKIVELKKLKEETTAIAEKLGKKYIKSGKEQRIEGELLNLINPVISKVAEQRTKELYDKIPAEQKENVSREDYRESLKSNLATMAINEFTQGKQDLEKFIVNRGYLRSNALAKSLGIESTEEFGGPGIVSDITESAEVASEATPEVEIEVAEKAPAKKLKEVKETLSEENQKELKNVVAKLNLTEDQLTFKTLPNAAIEIFAKQIGIPAKKFDGKANFTRNELDKVINFIEENISTIRQALPEAAVAEGSPVSENLIGTATGVPNNLLKDSNLYTRQDRGTRLSGLIAYVKNKGIDNNSILKAIGNVDGRRMASPRDKQAQTAKGLINMLAKFATNQEVRKQKTLTPKQRSNVEVGKGSKLLYSLTTKGDGKWVQNPLNPLDNKEKIYSFKVGDTDYNIKTSGHKVGSLDVNAYGFEIFDGNKFEEEFINGIANDDKSLGLLFADKANNATQITGAALKGLTNQFKVFGIVANSTIDLIKKEKLNSITFNGREESRQKLYEAMVQKFKKELGWESYNYELEEGSGEAYIVYDPKVFTNPETPVTTEKESGVLYSKNIDQKTVDRISTIIDNFKTSNDYTNLNNEVLEEIRNELAVSEIKTLGDVFDIIKNIAGKTLSTIKSKREFEVAILNSLINITEDSNTKNELLEAFKTYRKLFKYEQNVIGYNYSLEKLKNNFKGTNTEKIETVKKYLKFISRSVRTLGIDGLKTNELLFKKLDNELGEGKLEKLGFGIEKVTDKKNKTRSYITLKKNRLAGLQDITEIKRNPKEFSGIVKTESEEVLDYYIELIKEAKTATELEQIKSLIALTSADQRGMLRKLSTLGFAIKPFKGEKLILEHQTTALELFTKIIDFIDGNIKETELRSFVNQAKINLVPESFAILLDSEKTQNGNARYETEKAKTKLEKYKKEGRVIDLSIKSKSLMPLANSKSKAAVNNNNKLSKSQRINEPKSWWKSDMVNSGPSKMVLDRMKSLDNQANEERIKYSKSQDLDDDFNKIIEAKTGIKTYQRFDRAGATVKGASKGKFNFFIPPSAEDFVGLLYKTLAKGKVGDIQMQWFKDNLINPYARAMNDVSSARVAMFEDYKTLKNDLKIIPKDLKKKSFDEYTREQAVRVYIWDQQGNKIPGIFKTNQQSLVDYVNNNADLKAFADQLVAIQKGDQYSSPNEGWLAGSITTDLLDSVNSIKRKKYLEQWQTNVDEIFGETNMNKLEAAFGKPYREALTNILTRMKTGRNKPFTSDSLAGRFTNWLNNSVGAIMFFNTRSAVLQLLSSINFVNFTDNNPLKAGAAFANQPQYWKDFKFLFNSDFLKERRGGLRFNVSESEIADAAQKGGAKGVISKILQAGFLPTQMADSFAIATGGATFYRNRVKTYTKQGLTEAEANEKAFQDFRETAEESQQSSRPDRISAQQAGPLGRTILAFANTPAQYARLTKKAASDIINGRGDLKTNLSKLAYYGAVQNLIFNFLQQAVFALAFGDESDEEEKKKEEKLLGVANGMADSFLRGIGVAGAITATLKNALIKIIKEDQKARPDYAETTVIQLLGISPPVQSKAQKIRSALKSYEWNKDEMKEKGFSLDNPAYLAGANVISAGFNVPLDRVVKKVDNIKNSTQDDISTLNRIMLLAGWSDWQLDIQKEKPKKSKNSRVKIKKSSSRTGKRKVTTR